MGILEASGRFWFLIPLILVCRSITAKHCNESCGGVLVPYPFGIHSECAYSPHFRLLCEKNTTLKMQLKTQEFRVLSFTHNSIVIDPVVLNASGGCRDNVDSFDSIRNHTFVLSYENYLILYSCPEVCVNNCLFNDVQWLKSTTERSRCGTPTCCYDLHYASTLDLRQLNLSCRSFTSWVTRFKSNSQQQVSVEAQYGLELEWAFPGECNCKSKNRALCVRGKSVEGYTCRCEDGFRGDPYNQGCRPVACTSTMLYGCLCQNGRPPGRNGCGRSRHRKAISGLIIFAVILAGATIFGATVIAIALLTRRRGHRAQQRTLRDVKQLANLLSSNGNCNKATLFSYKELEKATKGFAPSEMLGHGGHGTVYAGKLPDGRNVAVKKINHSSSQGIEQMMNEVNVLLTVNHPHLVQLLGCCLEFYDPLLVYEYVPNGTLAEHLQRERGVGLDWFTRVTIATEASQAIAYLHSVNPPVYHRDIKSTNILLDYEYNTKVGDFGLSKLVLTEASHISTAPQGTPGYLDPEYHQNFQLSDKSDVYSFGVVLVEIMTAMKVVDFTRDKREVNLAALAVMKIATDSIDEIVDPFLQVEMDKNPVVRCMIHRVAELAFRCLAYEKDARPAMGEVFLELENIRSAGCISPGDASPIRDIKIDESCLILPR